MSDMRQLQLGWCDGLKPILKTIGVLLVLCVGSAQAARIGDVVDVHGIRSNPLMGTGLVVGLNGTGDSALPSAQMLTSLLRREAGVTLSPNDLRSANIALVMVTAELGPWDQPGATIDITVSAIGDAGSLQGGMLLATELKGLDGEVYAVARVAALSTNSWSVEGRTGTRATKNHPTVGRIPNGANVERSALSRFVDVVGQQRIVTLRLRRENFTTAERIRQAINKQYPGSAYAPDPGTIRVRIPDAVGQERQVQFVDSIMQMDVEVDVPAIVVINERTGTIVVGGNVTISETAVTQGGLVVRVKEQQFVSQPTTPFTEGTTAVVDDTAIAVEEGGGPVILMPKTVTVEELANALNAIGASPRDLVAIFDALNRAGALHARLEMM